MSCEIFPDFDFARTAFGAAVGRDRVAVAAWSVTHLELREKRHKGALRCRKPY
jgi:hypothetical protein